MSEEMQKLKTFLCAYSFEDQAKAFFIMNIWLPNIASPIKSQYLYVVLEEIFDKLPTESKIKSYKDFKIFSDQLLPLIPSFPMMEDYLPEGDWGEIKYFFRDKFFKIFYGGDLSNTYDSYYSFEVTHRGFDNFYIEKVGRSVLDELEFCLELQNEIIVNIDKSSQKQGDVNLGDFETPSEDFWNTTNKFLNNFKPENLYEADLIKEYTKDFDTVIPTPIPSLGEFQNRAHSGKNSSYFFVKKDGKILPVLPRKFFSVLFDKWGETMSDLWEEIEKEVKMADTMIGFELSRFIQERSMEEDVFTYASAIKADLKPHKTVFTTVFRSKDRLVLIHVIPPASLKRSQLGHLDNLVVELRATQKLLSTSPTRIGLLAQSRIVEFRHKNQDTALKPLIITVIPHTTSDFGLISQPNDFVGEIVGMDQLVGIFDELENLDELADFFEFQATLDSSFDIATMASLLDIYGSYKDSQGILLAGADTPDKVFLDPHWGSSYRYRSLVEFWKIYPDENFFGHPRSWSVVKKAAEVGDIILNSRRFLAYVYYRAVGTASIFLSAPMDSLSDEQGSFTDSIMNSLYDAFKIYEEDLKILKFALDGEKIHILFFTTSFIKDNEKVKHLHHLIPAGDIFWNVDITRLRFSEFGVRVVLNDEKLTIALRGAKDRSIQVQLFIDILKQINTRFGDEGFESIEEKMNIERAKPNRFRLFALKKDVSFPKRAPNEVPEEKELRLANKKNAEIAHGNKIFEGEYEGENAKEKVIVLRDSLIAFLNEKVKEYKFEAALPVLISNIDGLTASHDRKSAMIQDSLDQEVDYQREVSMGRDKQHFLHHHASYKYLIEKFVQLQPAGQKELGRADLRELLAYVDVLLNLYIASDFLHYAIYPTKIRIESDFQVSISYGADINKMQTEYAQQQARLSLGQIGNKSDYLSPFIEDTAYLDQIDKAFKTDLAFGYRNLLVFQKILAGWAAFNDEISEDTYYSATLDEIKAACIKVIKEYDPSETEAIVKFLMLDPNKILMIEGDSRPAADLPVWEYRKRATRYSLKPLIQIGERYYWGSYSVDRSGKIWSRLMDTHTLPADISAPSIEKVLENGHKIVEGALQEKIKEIVLRSTSEAEKEVHPFKLGLYPHDIGDIDIFAFLRSKNIILNIESKIINQAYCNKDLQRICRDIFGRTDSGGSFVKGYLQKVEDRETYLKSHGKNLAARYWEAIPENLKIISIFVTQTSYWDTKNPPIKTEVNFVELQLLEDFIKSLISPQADEG